MGLTCSLLGHDFGDAATEREREERGDEVVVIEREVRECRRCGTERVVSENTEVRSVVPREDVGGADDADAETAEAAPDEAAVAGAGAGVDSDAEDGQERPAGDDGVILDDGEEGAADRRPGEWPDASDTRVADPDDGAIPEASEVRADADDGPATATDEPDDGPATATDEPDDGPATAADASPAAGTSGEDEAVDVPPDEREDVEVMESGGGDAGPDADPAADAGARGGEADADGQSDLGSGPDHEWPGGAGRAPGADDAATPDREWPDQGVDGGAVTGGGDVEYVGGPERETPDDAGFVSAADESAGDGTEFVCPNCGYTQQVARTSLRAGDICPSCQKGYLGER